MTEINRDKMFAISDKVIKDYFEKAGKEFTENPYAESFISAIADISALIVLEYHKEVTKKD